MSAQPDYQAAYEQLPQDFSDGVEDVKCMVDAACAPVIAERDELAFSKEIVERSRDAAWEIAQGLMAAVDHRDSQLDIVIVERDRYREALERIATWGNHDQFVAGWEARFQHARQIAREALNGANDEA